MDTKSALEIKNLDIFEEISFNDSEKLVGGAPGVQSVSSGKVDPFIVNLVDSELPPIRRRTFRFTSGIKNYQQYRRNTVPFGSFGSYKIAPLSAWYDFVGLI